MKKFLSIDKFKELMPLFIMEIIIGLLVTMLVTVNKIEMNYWDSRAFTLSIIIWVLSSIVDKEKFWNLATLLGIGSFMYFLWLFILNVLVF